MNNFPCRSRSIYCNCYILPFTSRLKEKAKGNIGIILIYGKQRDITEIKEEIVQHIQSFYNQFFMPKSNSAESRKRAFTDSSNTGECAERQDHIHPVKHVIWQGHNQKTQGKQIEVNKTLFLIPHGSICVIMRKQVENNNNNKQNIDWVVQH